MVGHWVWVQFFHLKNNSVIFEFLIVSLEWNPTKELTGSKCVLFFQKAFMIRIFKVSLKSLYQFIQPPAVFEHACPFHWTLPNNHLKVLNLIDKSGILKYWASKKIYPLGSWTFLTCIYLFSCALPIFHFDFCELFSILNRSSLSNVRCKYFSQFVACLLSFLIS